MNRIKGFTLIELLVIVAILGVLAAVVIPNVVGLMAREKHYDTGNGTYHIIKWDDTCIRGNWICGNTTYRWFCPKPTPSPESTCICKEAIEND